MNSEFWLDLVTASWLGLLGACIGSFLNVVAYRLPRGMSIVWQPSHCPKCGHAIRAYDNVPVLGWIWLRGRCRDCGEPISPRYAIVEFVMGLAFFVLAYVELFSSGANLAGGPITELTGAADVVWNPQWEVIGAYAYHCLLLSMLMCAMLISQDEKELPQSFLTIAVIVGCIAPWNWSFKPMAVPVWQIPIGRLAGGFVGWGCSVLLQLSAFLRTRNLSPVQFNGIRWMLVLVGIYIGPQGAFVAYLSSCILVGIWNVVDKKQKVPSESKGMIGVFCGASLSLVFSPQIDALIGAVRNT